jgi:acylpyruvate hydrolase
MASVQLIGSPAPIPVGKIVCIGQNYAKHAKEMNFDLPKVPVFFLKPPSAIIAGGGHIVMPEISDDVHHEVELTVLIGKGGKSISQESAHEHIAGYGVGLDMTMRDIQAEAKKNGLPWTLAKGFDTSAPLSEFVPAARIDTTGSFLFELKINGEIRQSGSSADMIFAVPHLISYLSRFVTLEAGDVLYTGTPEGVSRVRHGDRLEAVLRSSGGAILTSLSVSVA